MVGDWEERVTHKVREAMRIVERDGWYHDHTTGSHRIYKHPVKPGHVVIPGRPGADLHPFVWRSIMKQAGLA